jgi:hypothetical protein
MTNTVCAIEHDIALLFNRSYGLGRLTFLKLQGGGGMIVNSPEANPELKHQGDML